MGHAILGLAGVGRRAKIDEQISLGIDRKGMHRMVTRERQTGHDDFRLPARRDFRRGQSVAHDAVVDFGEKPAVVERDACAARAAAGNGLTEPDLDIGPAVPLCVLESDQEATRGWGIVMVITAAPGVDIHDAILTHNEVTRVT